MNFRNISAWSIINPIIPIILFIGLTLAGIVSFNQMEIQNDPDIEFPVVIVMIAQPGAAPTELSTQVTEKVESAVRSVNGVVSISSTINEGASQTALEFELGVDVDVVVNEVKAAVDQIRGDLPDGILEPRVFKVQTSNNAFANYAVESEDLTLEQLSWFVDDTVSKSLLSVAGMAGVERRGGVDREIRVILDPARMQSFGVTAAQVNSILRQTNVDAAGGTSEIAGTRQSVRVLGNADTAFQMGQRQIAIGGGRTVKLADIATVSDGIGERKRSSTVNGKEVVTFGLTRAKGKSDVSVYDGAQLVMQDIEKNNPGIKFVELTNDVKYTKAQYKSSMAAMIEGALLAIVVVFLFLRDWRATIISAIAIPLSAIPSFWFLDAFLGFTLNSMSLLALGLVAGVLVDDAIVEIENIVRHMRMGKSAYQASIDAADEIGLAVVATTFSIVGVFLPVGLMPGVAGQFFRNFGLTIVVSVLMSLAVARMITPMIAAYFMKEHGEAEHAGGKAMDWYIAILRWTLDKSRAVRFRAKGGGLRKMGSIFLDHRIWIMGVAVLSLVLTGFMISKTPTQFFPDFDVDYSRVQVEMVPGTTLAETQRVAFEAEAIIKKEPEVETVLTIANLGGAFLVITLKDERERTSQEFERDTGLLLADIADGRVNFMQNGPGGGGGGSGRAISVMLSGSDPILLNDTAATLVEQMKDIPLITAPRIDAELQRPEMIITPRNDLAAQLGVTTSSLSQAIRIATIGEIDQNSAKFSLSDRQIPIRVMLPEDSRGQIATIRNLPVPTSTGGSVPLSRVADIKFGSGPTTIERYNQQRRVFIGADLAKGVAKGDADKAINALPIMTNLPSGVSNSAFGQDRWEQEMIRDFAIALISGVLLVFAVLVLLYKRFMSPLVNMGSLLLAPLGGILAINIIGQPLSMPVFIGILMLFGIVAKNSILLVDFAIEEMSHGARKFDAIMEAGKKRAQPIVMTTVAMTAGMIPTALSLGGDGGWRAPMGTVVIGGLIVSTFLTLLIVPAGFSLADGIEKRSGPWLRRNLLTYDPNADHGEHSRPTGHQTATIVQPAE